MNRTLKDATVGRYHYSYHEELKKHLHAFLMAYNLAGRLKTLKGTSPYEFIKKVWATEPERFRVNPNQLTLGLNKFHTIMSSGYKRLDLPFSVHNKPHSRALHTASRHIVGYRPGNLKAHQPIQPTPCLLSMDKCHINFTRSINSR